MVGGSVFAGAASGGGVEGCSPSDSCSAGGGVGAGASRRAGGDCGSVEPNVKAAPDPTTYAEIGQRVRASVPPRCHTTGKARRCWAELMVLSHELCVRLR